MDKYIISAEEISANNVKSAADLLKGDPAQNKSVFDRLPELIAERLNGFITAVKAKFAEYYTKAETEAVIDERMQQAGNADMQQAVYDKNRSGVVDDAERLGGHLPEYFDEKSTAAQQTADEAMAILAAMGLEVVWQNASASSSMSAQEITIVDTTKYKFLMLIYKEYAGGNSTRIALMLGNGETVSLDSASTKGRRYRGVSVIGTSFKINAGNEFKEYGESSSQNNESCIPVALYGLC